MPSSSRPMQGRWMMTLLFSSTSYPSSSTYEITAEIEGATDYQRVSGCNKQINYELIGIVFIEIVRKDIEVRSMEDLWIPVYVR